ncbi:DDE-domain-containing protein, partial [Choiromyces venosus 120613-1]
VYEFLQCHLEHRSKYSKQIEHCHALKLHTPLVLMMYFDRLAGLIQEYTIEAKNIYNFDEIAFILGCSDSEKVIVDVRPFWENGALHSTNRELVSVCETISGDGAVLPPLVIIPGVIHQEPWYTTTSIPDDYLIGRSETGYSNDELSMKWLAHFQIFSQRLQVGVYRLLLLDGFGSHCTKQFIDYCDNHKIVVFCLPPHTSYLLQPLDVVVFQPYKYYH